MNSTHFDSLKREYNFWDCQIKQKKGKSVCELASFREQSNSFGHGSIALPRKEKGRGNKRRFIPNAKKSSIAAADWTCKTNGELFFCGIPLERCLLALTLAKGDFKFQPSPNQTRRKSHPQKVVSKSQRLLFGAIFILPFPVLCFFASTSTELPDRICTHHPIVLHIQPTAQLPYSSTLHRHTLISMKSTIFVAGLVSLAMASQAEMARYFHTRSSYHG
jgi:hypothetical protein